VTTETVAATSATTGRLDPEELAGLVTAIQSRGLRIDVPIGAREGGAGPADAGMLFIDGVQTTVPVAAGYVADSPYSLRGEDDGSWAVYEGSLRRADASLAPRPKYYDLSTADGIPYWQIALMHLDSMASTVLQTCAYWGNSDQCKFCGIGVSLAAGRTIAKKTPAMLAEVSVAARDLDGAVDATLTTGSTATPDRGAMYVGRCGEAVKAASGLPVQVQFEPPSDLDVIDRVADMGIDSVGIHVESFDPEVLARVAPGKARWGIEAYFGAWERAVKAFGSGQVSTYVILGMGEDPRLTIEGCKRAIDMGVYPFVVPLRPVPGSLMADQRPPAPELMAAVYLEVAPYLASHGMSSATVAAGCARCGACSGLHAFEHSGGGLGVGRPSLPLHIV
jgi:radical SAM protein (TIGR04043 family)